MKVETVVPGIVAVKNEGVPINHLLEMVSVFYPDSRGQLEKDGNPLRIVEFQVSQVVLSHAEASVFDRSVPH